MLMTSWGPEKWKKAEIVELFADSKQQNLVKLNISLRMKFKTFELRGSQCCREGRFDQVGSNIVDQNSDARTKGLSPNDGQVCNGFPEFKLALPF